MFIQTKYYITGETLKKCVFAVYRDYRFKLIANALISSAGRGTHVTV